MRAKGLALSGIIVNAIGFINQFAGPIGLANIKYKYIWSLSSGSSSGESTLHNSLGGHELIRCGSRVESHGRSLEELDWVYDQPSPVRASLKIEKVMVQADGHVTEKISA